MLVNTFGTKIPETAEEFNELYDNGDITFVAMMDKDGMVVEVATFDVIDMMMREEAVIVNQETLMEV